MIPTSIDGTDITGATIDGTEVTEITVDGQTVFSAAYSPPANATHAYPDATGTDFAGNDDLTLSGVSTVTGSRFTSGEAFDFSSGGDADATLSESYNDPLTLIAFAEPTGNQSNFNKIIQLHDNSAERALIQVNPSTNTYGFATNDGSFHVITSSINASNGVLRGLALRLDGGVLEAFINGSSVGTTPAGMSTSSQLNVGHSDIASQNQRFIGFIDEPLVFDFALTNQEIADIHNNHPR